MVSVQEPEEQREPAAQQRPDRGAPAPAGFDLFSGGASAPGTMFPPTHTSGHPTQPDVVTQGLQDLAMLNLGESETVVHSGVSGQPVIAAGVGLGVAMPSSLSSSNPFISFTMPGSPLRTLQGNPVHSEASLSNLHVPLESIKTSKALPVTAYDKDGVRVLLHFGSECPPGRPDVLVIVVSMLNTAPLAVKNVELQAAVPKSMRVKLQSPSGSKLAPFNPILPPSSITQVMLLANPLKEKVRLRYKLMFLLGERQYCEVGELDQFPPPERWGNL
ncbi:hypothetical protein QTP86_033958 [Hemibagrus guttatus]|nr:hypothetical protein QTP86_033958 [Hemibagrus guttatus]